MWHIYVHRKRKVEKNVRSTWYCFRNALRSLLDIFRFVFSKIFVSRVRVNRIKPLAHEMSVIVFGFLLLRVRGQGTFGRKRLWCARARTVRPKLRYFL